MISPSATIRVMPATRPVDFRKGMKGLAALAREHMKADSFSGAVWVFRVSGPGKGVFRWPKIGDGVMRLSSGAIVGTARRPGLAAADSRGARPLRHHANENTLRPTYRP